MSERVIQGSALEVLDPARDGVRPTICHWPPEAVPARDAAIYESIRSRVLQAHCAAKRGPHRCCGRVTLDRDAMTLQCPLCGDLRLNTCSELPPQSREEK